MKKVFTLAIASLLMTGFVFAHEGGKKKGKECCKDSKECSKKEAKSEKKETAKDAKTAAKPAAKKA